MVLLLNLFVILCEYAHAMGNGIGLLMDYEEAFRTLLRLQGGSIWEWANHRLWKEDTNAKSYCAYGRDYEEKLHDCTFVMKGPCNSEHEQTPGLLDLKKVYQPVNMVDHLGPTIGDRKHV